MTSAETGNAWQLDPRLARDSVALTDIGDIQVRAMAAAPWPWLLLVPRHPGAVELFDLPASLQSALWLLTLDLSERLKRAFAADKINVAAIGNVVPQLHMHIVARRSGDPGWPGPVWGRSEPIPAPEAVAARLERLRELLAQIARS